MTYCYTDLSGFYIYDSSSCDTYDINALMPIHPTNNGHCVEVVTLFLPLVISGSPD